MVFSIAALALLGCSSLIATQQVTDSTTLRDRVAVLEARQRELEQELERLRAQLDEVTSRPVTRRPDVKAPAPIPSEPISIEGLSVKGSETAKVVVIEIADFQCPFCRRYYRETWPLIERTYVQTGRVRYAFQHLPLERVHPRALGAAVAAECAGQQGHFWAMHDYLFQNATEVAAKNLIDQAALLKLDTPRFRSCLTETGAVAVRRQATNAAKLGITSTPTFLIGTVDANGNVRAVRRISGVQPFPLFQSILDQLLEATER